MSTWESMVWENGESGTGDGAFWDYVFVSWEWALKQHGACQFLAADGAWAELCLKEVPSDLGLFLTRGKPDIYPEG